MVQGLKSARYNVNPLFRRILPAKSPRDSSDRLRREGPRVSYTHGDAYMLLPHVQYWHSVVDERVHCGVFDKLRKCLSLDPHHLVVYRSGKSRKVVIAGVSSVGVSLTLQTTPRPSGQIAISALL